MKKVILMISILFLCAGCTNINKMDYKDIINNVIKENSNNKQYNRYHSGYKYYLPKYMNTIEKKDFNEKITSLKYTYYLYVDVTSFYNKTKKDYKENNDYISYKFSYNNIDGYLNVSNKDDKYLLEIMYNYAKIEVYVDSSDINYAIYNSIVLLSTINYNNGVIENLLGDNIINSKEEVFNIFDIKTEKDNFIDIIDEYDTYDDKDDNSKIPDYDVIN